jgi:hypothetical protein
VEAPLDVLAQCLEQLRVLTCHRIHQQRERILRTLHLAVAFSALPGWR